MKIPKATLDEMNDLISKGKRISDINDEYQDYDYWDIYWQVNDSSFQGKKRMITTRLGKMAAAANKAKREELLAEIKPILEDLYGHLKINSKKLIQIDSVLRKDT